jgi:hypothetical protein
VPLVNTAPVRAQQAARHLGRLRRFQARHRLELRPQRPFSQVFEQGGGRRRVYPGPGQDSAQVLDQVSTGPGALFLLGQRNRFLRRLAQLELADRGRAGTARIARVRASGAAVPYRRRDRRQRDAERARELVRPARVQLREIQRALLRRARLEVRRLREARELALGRLASVALLELCGAAAHVCGD